MRKKLADGIEANVKKWTIVLITLFLGACYSKDQTSKDFQFPGSWTDTYEAADGKVLPPTQFDVFATSKLFKFKQADSVNTHVELFDGQKLYEKYLSRVDSNEGPAHVRNVPSDFPDSLRFWKETPTGNAQPGEAILGQ